MNISILKRIGVLFIFLIGIGIGASGLWLVIQNIDGVRYFLLDHPTGNYPRKKLMRLFNPLLKATKQPPSNYGKYMISHLLSKKT